MQHERASITLKISGFNAEIEPDRFVHGAFQLVVDGTPQSHVNMLDPSDLFFEYIRRIGHVIDLVAEPGKPITAVHLGAGAFTLPRYIEETRPGSQQQVIELESELVELVRRELPLPRRANIRVRHGDARDVVAKLPTGLRGTCDLVVVDIFSGARTPAHVTSREFYELLPSLLAPGGVVVVNVADGAGLAFARSQVATLASVFDAVAVAAEAQVLKGRRFGNLVCIASADHRLDEWMPRLMAHGPHPASYVSGAHLDNFIAGAPIVTDATAVPSPPPARSIFQSR
jgi:spermidine synthase